MEFFKSVDPRRSYSYSGPRYDWLRTGRWGCYGKMNPDLSLLAGGVMFELSSSTSSSLLEPQQLLLAGSIA